MTDKEFIEALVARETALEDRQDYDGYTELLNELFYSVSAETFERFAGIIRDANDSEMRSPK